MREAGNGSRTWRTARAVRLAPEMAAVAVALVAALPGAAQQAPTQVAPPAAVAPAAPPAATAPAAGGIPALPGPAVDTAPAPEGPGLAVPDTVRPTAPAPTEAAGPAAPEASPAQALPEPGPPTAEPDGAGAGGSAIGHDLSPWGMFLAADLVVKSVMVGLAFASLVTWTVWLAKSLEILFARRRLIRGLAVILGARDLPAAGEALANRGGPAAAMVAAARHEVGRSYDALRAAGGQGLLQRVTSHLGRIEVRAGRRLVAGTGVLATIGATAPFVGLFGTVWGIMNAFIGISRSQTTNLAVVAPGIAEALLATALGLVAAIPAVVIYNSFARWVAGYRALLGDAAAGVERLLSRDMDYQRLEAEGGGYRRAAE